jgi:ubiquinone/menaquinone biosynthesis C-methylase UbiE
MRLFFHLLYHPFSCTYDLVASAVSVGRWQQWTASSVERLAGPRVLELGFGPGHLQVRMQRAGFNGEGLTAYGLDESRQMAHQAYRRLLAENLSPRITRGLAQHLPYAGQSFDSVVATFPTLYITDPRTLAEIRRVLRPGGRLVVLMAAWITGNSPRERFIRRIYQVTQQVPPDDVPLESLIAPYQKAGFQARIRFIETPGARLLYIESESR